MPLSFDAVALSNNAIQLRGAGQPGSRVQVLVDGVVVNAANVRTNGAWAIALTFAQPGNYQISVRAIYPNRSVVQSITPPVTAVVAPPPPTATPAITIGTVQLVAPADNNAGTGLQQFQWTANFAPTPGLAFELVFWREGQSALGNGFGLAAPTTGNRVNVDLVALDQGLGALLDPGPYQWGILLVQTNPYQRIQLVSPTYRFRFERSGDSGSPSSDDGQSSGE